MIYDNHLGKMTTLHTLPDIPDRFLIVEFATAQIEDQAFSLFPRSLHLRIDGVLALPRGRFELPDLLIHFRGLALGCAHDSVGPYSPCSLTVKSFR